MKKIVILVFLMVVSTSCNNSEKEKHLLQKEIELLKKEKKLNEKEKEITKKEIFIPKITTKKDVVLNNIIHCENEKFIVKIDNLKNNNIRYTCWNKPKTISDNPDIVLYNGKVEIPDNGGYHYVFKKGDWKYIVENNFSRLEQSGIYLKLLKNGKRKLYKKMKDIKKKENYDKKSYPKSDIVGKWWTPHFAVRKLELKNNNRFIFKDGQGKTFYGKWKYLTNSKKSIQIIFDNGLDKYLNISGGLKKSSFTLTGDGENFVKEYNEKDYENQ